MKIEKPEPSELSKWGRISRFLAKVASKPPPQSASKYVDLAPTKDADKDGIYAEALDFATDNEDVFNIALTGPYGSGKSSVIRSFLSKRGSKSALHISLAAFLPDAGVPISKGRKQEIERSILQQMLYGEGADKVPNSRFKRIRSPNVWSSLLFPMLAIAGALSIWYLLANQTEIISGNFLAPLDGSNWFNLVTFVVALGFSWAVIRQLYLSSFDLTLKAISEKGIEITTSTQDKESILNRHLDEIIYFFQSTKYDLVIIEDLDRFNNPEIFVTLREINSLINANAGVRRQVRFLYALRDDMFITTDRTKFFEFIIPVVPIINHSNSIDKVFEQGERLDLIEHLNRQFLREVSRYLSDLRLIQNVFNEYTLYASKLNVHAGGDLDPNKLLAVIIYKNVLPQDFEALHRQKGTLSSLFALYDDFIQSLEANYKTRISDLETQIAEAKNQLPKSVSELRRTYAMALVEKLPQGWGYIQHKNETIAFTQLAHHDALGEIVKQSQVRASPQPNGYWQNQDIGFVEASIDRFRSFEDRVKAIELKSDEGIAEATGRINALKVELSSARVMPFHELVRADTDLAAECFSGFGENEDLMRFLIYEGHIDDTYYQYISLFHSGRLSPNDNRFLIKIRSFTNPDPDFQIDNPGEVIAAMRDEDFSQNYVRNRCLFDHMLSRPGHHASRLEKAIAHIAIYFKDCHPFFTDYYEHGRHVSELIQAILKKWRGFERHALSGDMAVLHAARFLAYTSIPKRGSLSDSEPSLHRVVSSATLAVLNEDVPFELERLVDLGIAIEDLQSISEHEKVLDYTVRKGLYQITIENLEFAYGYLSENADLERLNRQHFTCLLSAEDPLVLNRVNVNFSNYVENVLIALDTNIEESAEAIVTVLASDEVSTELLEHFWIKQSNTVDDLQQVPVRLHRFAIESHLIKATWANCLLFLNSDVFDEEILSSFMGFQDVIDELSTSAVPDSDEALPLRKFLIENDGFDDETYCTYVRQLPKSFAMFPEGLSDAKKRILIEERAISFSAKSLPALDNDDALKSLFVSNNISLFLKSTSEYELNESVLIALLETDISDAEKRAVIDLIDPNSIAENADLASIIGPILDRTDFDPAAFENHILQSMITNAKELSVQISLINTCMGEFDDQEIRAVLQQLRQPYSLIATYGRSPKIPNTAINLEFVEKLETRQLISSFKVGYSERDIRIYTFKGDTQ